MGSGFNTKNERSKESLKLLTWGLTKFETIKIAERDKVFTSVDVWQGKKNKLNVYLNDDIYETIPKAKKKYLKAVVGYDGPIAAPIKKK